MLMVMPPAMRKTITNDDYDIMMFKVCKSSHRFPGLIIAFASCILRLFDVYLCPYRLHCNLFICIPSASIFVQLSTMFECVLFACNYLMSILALVGYAAVFYLYSIRF
jgi:hypothetical protein